MTRRCTHILAMLCFSPTLVSAQGVIVGDREWRQLTDTINLAWSEVASVCNSSTGACSGSIGGVSFDGWTWASIEDVQELFDQLIKPESVQFPTIETNYLAVNDPDIRAALGPSGFTPVPAGFGPTRTGGWVRTPLFPPQVWFAPYLLLEATPENEDFACLYCGGITDEGPQSYRGNWMYRPATPTQLIDHLATIAIGVGPGASFATKIAMLQSYYESGDLGAACAESTALLNQLQAQAGKRNLSDADAVRLTSQVNAFRDAIGCD